MNKIEPSSFYRQMEKEYVSCNICGSYDLLPLIKDSCYMLDEEQAQMLRREIRNRIDRGNSNAEQETST